MNPVSESHFLPPFLAIAASLVLVCGSLLLLTQTAPWTSRDEAGSSIALPMDGAGEAAPKTLAFAPSASTAGAASSEQADATESGDAPQVAEAEPAEPQQATPEPMQPVVSEPSPAQAEDAVHAPDVPQVDGTADAPDVGQRDEARADAMDVAQVDEIESGASEAIAAESMIVSEAEPMPEDTVEIGAVPETAPVKPGAVEADVAAEAFSAPSDQIGEMLAEPAPQAIPAATVAEHAQDGAEPAPDSVTAETISEDTSGAETTAAAETAGGANPAARSAASPKVTAAVPVPLPPPPPPLPKRKPEIEVQAPVQTARAAPQPQRPSRPEAPKQVQARSAVTQQPPKQAQAASAVAEQATGQPYSGPGAWLPMALAPANKPVAKEPAARLSGAAYSSKVWAALARSKPRAGQNGNATVVFSIGAGGALSGVRIGKSSGNAKIDQLALATVRGAAPFPPPPSGPASFSIRIDFH